MWYGGMMNVGLTLELRPPRVLLRTPESVIVLQEAAYVKNRGFGNPLAIWGSYNQAVDVRVASTQCIEDTRDCAPVYGDGRHCAYTERHAISYLYS